MKSRAGLLREERQDGTGEGGADGRIITDPECQSKFLLSFSEPQITSAVDCDMI